MDKKEKRIEQQLTSVVKKDDSEKVKVYLLLGLIILLAVGLILIYKYDIGVFAPSLNDTLKLANCLTEKGFVMYGLVSCGACNFQKQMFGEYFDKINYIECSQNAPNSKTEQCISAGIVAVPTWEVEGELLQPGVRTLEILREESGC